MKKLGLKFWIPALALGLTLGAATSFACQGKCDYKKKSKTSTEAKINETLDKKTNENSMSITLAVVGMDCNDCGMSIQKTLHQYEGVQKVRASYKENSVSVTFDKTSVTEKKLIEAINEIGYSASLPKTEEKSEG